jgi:four helix bundle protein
MSIKNFQDLEVWKLSKDLTKDIYDATSVYPADERFGIVQQMRRTGISIMSNIAEGSGRRSKQEFMRFINIASGSACELQAQIFLSVDLLYITQDAADILLEKTNRICKMLFALHRSLSLEAA